MSQGQQMMMVMRCGDLYSLLTFDTELEILGKVIVLNFAVQPIK